MKILIGGLARTGTTGLFYLIANSIGYKPKLLFEATECPENLESESKDILAKVLIGSKLNAASFSNFDKKITLVRDPRDRIVSSMLYSQYHASYLLDDERVRAVRDMLEQKEASPSSVSIREILEVMGKMTGKSNAAALQQKAARMSLALFDNYVKTIPDGLLYRYEDFVWEKYYPLEKHLGIPLMGVAEVPRRVERVIRTKRSGGWRDWFTEEDIRAYRPLLAAWLEKYGYDAEDWALNAKPFIRPEHCSAYFMRLVNEQRERNFCKAKILRAEPRVVAGWAFGSDPRQPIRVALLVNGNEVAQAVADKPSPGLKEKGLHPTGNCGFAFRFEPGTALQVGDQVSVRRVDSEFKVNNAARAVVAAS